MSRGMDLDAYQDQTRRMLVARADTPALQLEYALLGLTEEVGEMAARVARVAFWSHPLDRAALVLDLGDVSWYLAIACSAAGLQLSQVLPPVSVRTISHGNLRLALLDLCMHTGQLQTLLCLVGYDHAARPTHWTASALYNVGLAWLRMCYVIGATPQEVLAQNLAKASAHHPAWPGVGAGADGPPLASDPVPDRQDDGGGEVQEGGH